VRSNAAEYAVEGVIQESEGSTLYRARRIRDGARVGLGAAHPLVVEADEMRKAGVRISTLTLRPLSREQLAELIADTAHRSVAESLPLARIVHDKTAGNPFFAIQFLGALHREGLLAFDAETRAFRWDVAEIAKKGYTDNVVALMVGKIRRLAEPTQDALKIAACLGSPADAGTLAVVRERTPSETHGDLEEAVREGILIRGGDAYRFLHDRVQQAACALIPEGERPAVHLRIGRVLARSLRPEEVEARVFEIVGHMNLGAALISDPSERGRLAALDLVAGRRARASAAYTQAAGYLAAGTALLGEDAWIAHHTTALSLHLEHAWCAFLSGDFATAERLVEALFRHASGRLALAAVHGVEIPLAVTKGEYERAYQSALVCLRRFGIDLPRHPTRDEIARAIQEARHELRGRSIESLVDLPLMVDPDVKAAAATLSAASPAAYYTGAGLSDLVTCHVVLLSLRHVRLPLSAGGAPRPR
jgi:predicted ATPase